VWCGEARAHFSSVVVETVAETRGDDPFMELGQFPATPRPSFRSGIVGAPGTRVQS
jgi:hypothetical protein